jgi:hypothetical protein
MSILGRVTASTIAAVILIAGCAAGPRDGSGPINGSGPTNSTHPKTPSTSPLTDRSSSATATRVPTSDPPTSAEVGTGAPPNTASTTSASPNCPRTQPLPGGGSAIIDYVDFLRLYGQEYISGEFPATNAKLGPVVARVHCTINDLTRDYKHAVAEPLRNGDAAFIPVGAPIHAVNGYSSRCLLAVAVAGKVRFYRAQHEVNGHTANLPCALNTPPAGADSKRAPAVRLALPRGGPRMQTCIRFSAEALMPMEMAFDGTAVQVASGRVVIRVGHWYRGGDAPRVELTTPVGDSVTLEGSLKFQQGRRYLVTASDGVVNSCGFTLEWAPEAAATFQWAFAG